MKIHEWTRRQSFPFLLVVHVCGIFPWQTIFTSAIFNLSTRQQDLQICCHEKLGRWVKNFFFVAEQFYFIVTATFFISNELPFLRIAQKVKALASIFHKPSFSQNFNFNFTKRNYHLFRSSTIHNFNSKFWFRATLPRVKPDGLSGKERLVWLLLIEL